jgi:hypothetical protein
MKLDNALAGSDETLASYWPPTISTVHGISVSFSGTSVDQENGKVMKAFSDILSVSLSLECCLMVWFCEWLSEHC